MLLPVVSSDAWIHFSGNVFYAGHYPCLSSVQKSLFFMLNPPYALFSSDKIFFKTPHEFPKGRSLEDSSAEKMSEILLKGENNHCFFSLLP